MKKFLLAVLIVSPGFVAAGEYNFPKTYNVNVNSQAQPVTNYSMPAVNFNPAPAANPIDSAMNGISQGQQMRMNEQQIEMNQAALDQANRQHATSSKPESKKLDGQGCATIKDLDDDMLKSFTKESLVKIIRECL